MRCYLIAKGHVAYVEFLKTKTDVERIAESKFLFDRIGKERGADGFEVWDGSRMVFHYPEDGARKPPPDQIGPAA
jgi:hypothetical protein